MLLGDELRVIGECQAHIEKLRDAVEWYRTEVGKYQQDAVDNPEDNERYLRVIEDYRKYAEKFQGQLDTITN